MEARSYVENIANRTTMRGVVHDMTRILMVAALVAGPTVMLATPFHPLAIIIGSLLLILGVVLIRDAVVVGRRLREEPLDLAFEPAPDRGPVTPGVLLGVAGGIGLFAVVLLLVASVMGDMSLGISWGAIGLGLALVIAAMSLPTFGVQKKKWAVLSRVLDAHPDQIPYLQDARRRFPQDAPFPFEAPTDVVVIPPEAAARRG